MLTSRPPARVEPVSASTPVDPGDGVLDLTDRRRILLRVLFGVDLPDPDDVFITESCTTPDAGELSPPR